MAHALSYPNARQQLRSLFDTAVARAYPGDDLLSHLPAVDGGQIIVVGAGKAGAAMAQVVERSFDRISAGLVLVPYGHSKPCSRVEIVEAGHPVPDTFGYEGAKKILALATALGEGDSLICLLSGGGSALLNLPLEGITLEEKRAVTKDLLISGATIHEINTVRKHLSRVKGGRLAKAAFPARTITLAISDVPGDDPSTIASGPTVGDRTTRGDAVDILRKYHLELPPAIDTLLASDQSESPNPDDASLSRTEYSVTATAADALRAAASLAQQRGFQVAELGDNVEGLAQDIAAEHARLFQDLQHGSTPSPFLMLSGGELTVRVNGMGRGGPNQEYLLALAIALDGRPDTFAIACDTDGIDGASTSAGALITPDTLARARSLGMHPQDYLRDNNAGAFFERLGDLVTTGPTCTNVNDFRAIAYIPGGD